MKSLLNPRLSGIVAVIVFFLVLRGNVHSQCSVNAGPDVNKCYGQPYNPGPNVTVSGTTGTVTYSYNSGPFNPTPNTSINPVFVPPAVPPASFTYTLTIQDASGCTASDQFIVNVLALPTVSAGPDFSQCAGSPHNLCATASSPNGAITLYTWTSGPSSQCWNIAPVSQTTYNVTVVDAAGCQKSDAATVFINPLPTVGAGSDQSMCLSQGTMQLTGSPAGGTWTGTGVNSSGLFTASTTGNFTLTYSYTNANGCTNTDQVVVSVTTPTPINGGPDVELCLNDPSEQLPNVGTWTGSALVSAGGLFSATTAGSYNLTVTSGSPGCTVSDNVTVNVLALPVVGAGADIGICTGQNTTLNGSSSSVNGPITSNSWAGASLSDPSILNPIATPGLTTNYTLTSTDSHGCSASDNVTVSVNAYPSVNAGSDVTLCSNSGAYNMPGFSPWGGTWTGTGVSSAGVFTPSTVGNFTLTYSYTNGAGCSASDQVIVSVVAPGTVNAGNDVTICLNTPAFQLASGGTWSGSTHVTSGGLFTPSATGTFNLTYTASTGLCMATDQISVLVLALPTTNAGADQAICNGHTAQLDANATSPNGAINAYTWTGGTVSDNLIDNPTTTPTLTTNFTVTATDVMGCSSSDIVNIQVNAVPTTNAGFDFTTCINGGPVALAGFSPIGGTWSGTNTDIAGVFTPTSVGTFVLTYSYTNGAGCTDTDQVEVAVINPGSLNAGSDVAVCHNSGTIQLASGGTWSGSPLVTPAGVFTPSTVGDYTLTYTAMSGGCWTSDDIIVHVLTLPTANAGANASVCTGSVVQLNGSATSPNGSITSYHWTSALVSNQDIHDPTIIANGNYTLTMQATDAMGCVSSDQVDVVANPNPVVNAGNDVTFCNQPIPQQLTGFSPSGGTWTGSGVTNAGVFTPGSTGTFTLTYCYTNAFNCTVCDDITVTVTGTTQANAGSDVGVCQGSSNFNLTPVTGGGTWTTTPYLNSSGNFTPSTSGGYSLTYTLGTGSCQTTDQVVVTVHGLPTVSAGADGGVCEGEDYTLTGGGNGFLPLTYDWNNDAFLADPSSGLTTATVSSTTNFTLTITDGHNCSANDQMTLTVVPMPVAAFAVAATGCSATIINFDNQSTLATDYEWSFGNSSFSALTDPQTIYSLDGTYNITLTAYNSLGCSTETDHDIHIISAPVSDFTLSVTEGCSPLEVVFDNQSTGENFTSSWNLGGPVVNANEPSPTEFTTDLVASDFNIILTVNNICGSGSHTETITVNPQPHAAFTTDLSSQCSPVTTVFNNSSGGNPDSYLWDLGDGDTSSDIEPSPKVYITENTSEDFVIKLYAYNACGADSVESVVTVLPNTVEMNLQPSVPAGCSPLFVEFNNFTTGATNYTYDFDDTFTSNLMSPNHIFDEAGTYDVILYANDGCSFDTTMVTITVAQSPEITITVDESSVCPMELVHFHSNTIGAIAQIDWLFGDDLSSTETDPTHEYATGNTYFVSATATENNGCPATASLSFEVHPQPQIDVTFSTVGGCSPLNVCSTNNTTGATQYNWNFDNGFTSTAADECQEYVNTTGEIIEYVVTLDAQNQFGCADHEETIVTVQPQPETDFTLTADESCFLMENVGVTILTSGSTGYEWYADGTLVSESMTTSFSFDEVGEHEILVISSNDLGCTDTHSEVYTIHPTPEIDIMPNTFNGCAPLTVNFDNVTTNGASWQWTFGNGSASTLEQPQVHFINSGLFDIQLIATSEFGCVQVQHYDDMIEVFSVPTANFVFNPDDAIIYELDVAFTDSSSGATTYLWNFGDGTTSDEMNPVHHFNRGGYYQVNLDVENEYGCTAEMTKAVNIDNTFNLFMPNSFTPDGDGINDVFMPVISSKEEIKEYEFTVVNRWGEQVFKTNDPDYAWVGNIRNGEYYSHNDIFTWNIRVSFNNMQIDKEYTGVVTVLR